MAVELAQAYVSVIPSARGIGGRLRRELVSPLSTAGANAGAAAATSFGNRFTSGLTRVGKRAGLALTGALGTVAFFGIRTAANFEQTRIAFEGILGDVEKANSLIGDLRDFAARTPFEFTDLATAAKQLLAVGVAQDDIIPTMTTLGNVAATLGVGKEGIEGTVRALGQMKGKGKASAEELRQISEQLPGFSAIQVIAEELGVSTSEAFDLMERGAIPANDAIDAILQGMENFPGAAGAMERQSKTLNGVISTLKDTLAITAIDFISPYLPALSNAVRSFGGFLEDAAKRLKEFLDSEGFQEFKETVRGFVEDGLKGITDWWDRNGETVMGYIEGAFSTIGIFATTAGSILRDVLLPPLEKFFTWLIDDGPGVEMIVTGIAIAMGLYATNAALAAAATIAATWPFLAAAVIIGALAWATQKLIDKFDLLPKASTVFQWLIDNAIEPFIASVVDAIEAVEKLIDLVKSIPDKAVRLFTEDPSVPFGGRFERRVHGGRATAGLPYVVGENRPELFIPDSNGTILPALPSFGGGGDTYVTVNGVAYEDADQATLRALRKIRLMSAA